MLRFRRIVVVTSDHESPSTGMSCTGLQIIGTNMNITEINEEAQYLRLIEDETLNYFDQVDMTHMTTPKNGVKFGCDVYGARCRCFQVLTLMRVSKDSNSVA